MKNSTYVALILGSIVGIGFVACGSSSDVGSAGNTGGAASVAGSTSAGSVSTGGSRATAGSSATGGSRAVGGSSGVGGAATGGIRNTGGMTTTGGAKATGGMISVGGASSTGGAPNAGGNSAAGGAGGASAIQTACDGVCVIITGTASLSTCQLANCPTKCVAIYNDNGVSSIAGCQNALLTVLQCGAGQPANLWGCYNGFPVPISASTCINDILTLNNITGCTNALSAANQAN